ncbi:hypothetical protein [Lactiplantibacillus daowaiensis]|uniref:Capsular polysaccharide biosynthesis protein CpsC n=1 Tax=Lactiplantibacillus daowaiensis TaxID=2559918 RepID=A0ABW1RX95_9LACO|nr:hypothetical protein [Lactiplantibacillus daowaiensis]
MNSKFSFLPFFKVLWYRLVWIIVFALIGSGVGYYVMRKTYTPTYMVASSVDVHHKTKSNESNLDQLNTDVNRLGVVQSEMSDPGIYASVSSSIKDKNNISISVKALQNKVSVVTKPTSTILSVSATTDSAKKSSVIVDSVISSYKTKYTKKDKKLVVNQLSKARPSTAIVSKTPYAQYIKNGALIGGVLAYLVCLFLYYKQRKNSSRKRQQKAKN